MTFLTTCHEKLSNSCCRYAAPLPAIADPVEDDCAADDLGPHPVSLDAIRLALTEVGLRVSTKKGFIGASADRIATFPDGRVRLACNDGALELSQVCACVDYVF